MKSWKQLLIFIALCSPLAIGQSENLTALLKDVHTVGTHANEEEGPTAIAVYGENAFPVIVGEAEGKAALPIIVAARFGRGRVVALSEKGLLGDVTGLPLHDDDKFLANAIAWVRPESLRNENTRIRVIQVKGLAESLKARGYALAQDDSAWNASGADVIIAAVDAVSSDGAASLRKFSRARRRLNPGSVRFALGRSEYARRNHRGISRQRGTRAIRHSVHGRGRKRKRGRLRGAAGDSADGRRAACNRDRP